MLKLRDAEVARLAGELVQEVVSFEELHNTDEEKDATNLELQQAAETARAALETEKKQIKGKLPLSVFRLLLGFVEICSRLICFFTFSPADSSRDVSDPGRGDPDGLQLLSAGTGGSAGCGLRGVPEC
jgi:hypothetical protein